MKPKQNKSETIHLRLEPDLDTFVTDAAAAYEVSRAQVIRWALKYYRKAYGGRLGHHLDLAKAYPGPCDNEKKTIDKKKGRA